jgi:hypothetical protein
MLLTGDEIYRLKIRVGIQEFAGQNVKVVDILDAKTNTIDNASIEVAPMAKRPASPRRILLRGLRLVRLKFGASNYRAPEDAISAEPRPWTDTKSWQRHKGLVESKSLWRVLVHAIWLPRRCCRRRHSFRKAA